MDVVDRATRSRMMSSIRGKDTEPELVVRRLLHRAGLRFRLHVDLPGKPDLVLPKYGTAIFVHGCFWHRHEGCRFSTMPASNVEFWRKKFATNLARDARAKQELEGQGWRVEVLWSCQLSESQVARLARKLRTRGSKGRR